MSNISSTHNEKIRRLLALQAKSGERRASGLFVVEGQREVRHALASGVEMVESYVCPELTSEEGTHTVSRAVYERLAYRGSTEGIIALMRTPSLTLDSLSLPPAPLIVVAEGVEKPGNIGAILRTCDAAGVSALLLADCPTDIFNPNLIRSSLGAVFTVPTVSGTSEQCIDFLRQHHCNILTAQLQDSNPYYDVPMRGPTAIVLGNEATGLTQVWREAATAHVRIPMLGKLDSLNVSVSAAILIYEAIRQRNYVPTQRRNTDATSD